MGAPQEFAAHEFFHDAARRIVHQHDVVAVPADAPAHMQEDLGHELECGGNLIGEVFGGMEVPRVQAKQLLVFHGVAHVKLVRADNIRLGADAEELAFHGVAVERRVDWLGEDGVEGGFKPLARRFAVHRRVFVAVWNPEVGHAGFAELLADVGGDFAARDAVLDPELAHPGVFVGEGEAVG